MGGRGVNIRQQHSFPFHILSAGEVHLFRGTL